PDWLQRGRAHGSAEIIYGHQITRKVHPRFNGAALTGARKYLANFLVMFCKSGFNGAALTGARKSRAAVPIVGSRQCFNGAALTGARKYRDTGYIVRS